MILDLMANIFHQLILWPSGFDHNIFTQKLTQLAASAPSDAYSEACGPALASRSCGCESRPTVERADRAAKSTMISIHSCIHRIFHWQV